MPDDALPPLFACPSSQCLKVCPTRPVQLVVLGSGCGCRGVLVGDGTPPGDLEVLVDDLGFLRQRSLFPHPPTPSPFTCKIVLVPRPSLQTGECFRGRPACPQPAGPPWTWTSCRPPKCLTVSVTWPCLAPPHTPPTPHQIQYSNGVR